MELSTIIPVSNDQRFVPELFEALAEQRWDGRWEVVVADNGSRGPTLELIEGFRDRLPRLNVVSARAVRGSAHARNIGVLNSTGSSLLFIDSDDVPGDGYIAAMGEALRHHEFVCGRQEVERLNPEWTRRLLPSGQDTGPMMWNYNFLPYAAGGTLGMRRSLFEALGGFDEQVVLADCTDLCWRAQLDAGAKLVFIPDAVLHYRRRGTLRETFLQQRSYGIAEVGMYARYRPRGVEKIPVRWSLRNWWRVIRHLPRVRYRAGRAWLATELGNRVGRLKGSLAHWTLML